MTQPLQPAGILKNKIGKDMKLRFRIFGFALMSGVLQVNTAFAESWSREDVLDTAFDVRASAQDITSVFIRCGADLEQTFIEVIFGQDSVPGEHIWQIDGGRRHVYSVPNSGYFVVTTPSERAVFKALIDDLKRGQNATIQTQYGTLANLPLNGSSAALGGCSAG